MKILENLHGFLWTSMSANNCNSYLIDGPARILIDPGHLHLFGHVEKGLEELGLSCDDIDLVLATHCHPDHVEAAKLFKDRPALLALHETDYNLMKAMGRVLGAPFDMDAYTPDFFLKEGDFSVKGLDFQILHTPGHSPGSISLYWPEHRALFTGDVIFKEGLGRVDLPGGNGNTLKASIKRLSELEVEKLLPGHGDIIQDARLAQTNFRLVEQFWFAYL